MPLNRYQRLILRACAPISELPSNISELDCKLPGMEGGGLVCRYESGDKEPLRYANQQDLDQQTRLEQT